MFSGRFSWVQAVGVVLAGVGVLIIALMVPAVWADDEPTEGEQGCQKFIQIDATTNTPKTMHAVHTTETNPPDNPTYAWDDPYFANNGMVGSGVPHAFWVNGVAFSGSPDFTHNPSLCGGDGDGDSDGDGDTGGGSTR